MITWLTEPFTFGFMQRALDRFRDRGRGVRGHRLLHRPALHGLPRGRAGPRHPARRRGRVPAGSQPPGGSLGGRRSWWPSASASSPGRAPSRRTPPSGSSSRPRWPWGWCSSARWARYAVDLTHVLFGNVLGVTAADLWITGLPGPRACWCHCCCSTSSLLVVSFDPILGRTLGSTHPPPCAPGCS